VENLHQDNFQRISCVSVYFDAANLVSAFFFLKIVQFWRRLYNRRNFKSIVSKVNTKSIQFYPSKVLVSRLFVLLEAIKLYFHIIGLPCVSNGLQNFQSLQNSPQKINKLSKETDSFFNHFSINRPSIIFHRPLYNHHDPYEYSIKHKIFFNSCSVLLFDGLIFNGENIDIYNKSDRKILGWKLLNDWINTVLYRISVDLILSGVDY